MTMNDPNTIPLVDLSWQHALIADEVRSGLDRVMAAGSFILGPEVERFEQEYADYCGVRQVVGVGNGTDALELAFRAVGVEPGDEVVMPANTFVATAEAAARAGARVRLVDCDEDFLIDPALVEGALGPATRAVVGVDLYGQAAPFERLREVLPEGVALVEDAAQSQGARRNGERAGGLADIAGTSFYPGKNLGAYGDGGAVLTDSDLYAQQIRTLRNHGGTRRYEHLVPGVNSRLDGFQGVVLSAKLRRLDEWNGLRREAAARYDELLEGLPQVVRPRVVAGNEHVFHLYVVRVPRRDAVVAELNARGIGAAIHYPIPVHLTRAFEGLGHRAGDFPVAERLAGEILSLPIYPGITAEQQERIVAALAEALASARAAG